MIRLGGLLGAIGACGLLLFGCGSGSTVTAASTRASETTPPSTSAQEAEQASGDCTSALTGHEVRVTIYGEGEKGCEEFDRGAAKSSKEFWKITEEEPRGTPVCSMEHEATIIEVRDGGGQFYGTHICAQLLAQGWHETEGPGEKDERQEKETERHQQEQQAAQAQRRIEEERPAHEAAANKLSAEAANLRGEQHREQSAAKHDEAEAKRLSSEAEHAEGEASDNLYQQSDGVQQNADSHEQNADSFGSEAEAKETESSKEREQP
jgi:hypothetical protein